MTPDAFELPAESPHSARNWFHIPPRFAGTEQRDRTSALLLARGIDTANDLGDITDVARAQYGYDGDRPNAERLSRTTLLVPIHRSLRRRDVEHTAAFIKGVWLKRRLRKRTAEELPGGCIRLLRRCGYDGTEQVSIGEDAITLDDLRGSQYTPRIGDWASISPRGLGLGRSSVPT